MHGSRYKKRTLWTLGFAFMVVLYILSAGGCDFGSKESIKETDESYYVRAQEELRKGNIQGALGLFLKVTEKRTDAAESHLELGRIYLTKLDNPIRSIYHFEKYLELKPNSPSSPMVRQMIATAQKKFAASLPESPFENNFRRIELEDLLQKVQKENLDLKQKLSAAHSIIDKLEASQRVSVSRDTASARSQQRAPRRVETSSDRREAREIPSTYTAQPGDSLSSISRRVYGTPNRWLDIFKANRDRMSTPESLRAGQVLRIPR